MEILGIGMSELVFVILIAIIVLGPKDMQKAGKTVGKFLRGIVTSDGWKIFQQTSRELRTLPHKLIRDANDELNQIGNQIGSATPQPMPASPQRSKPYAAYPAPTKPSENTIAPGATEPKEKESESDQQNNA